jgi:uncharacterized protein
MRDSKRPLTIKTSNFLSPSGFRGKRKIPRINPDYTWYKLAIVKSRIHRHGVIALENIPAGAYVMEYTGVLLNRWQHKEWCKGTSEAVQIYAWEVPKDTTTWVGYWTLDGYRFGSGAEYVNASCDPNLEPIFNGKRLYYYSTRRIKKGEELTIFYGKPYFTSRNLHCSCGAPNCFK